jgi:hypothetical protein
MTHRSLNLAATLPSELANVVQLCLRGPGHHVSQELAEIWISEGIDAHERRWPNHLSRHAGCGPRNGALAWHS